MKVNITYFHTFLSFEKESHVFVRLNTVDACKVCCVLSRFYLSDFVINIYIYDLLEST